MAPGGRSRDRTQRTRTSQDDPSRPSGGNAAPPGQNGFVTAAEYEAQRAAAQEDAPKARSARRPKTKGRSKETTSTEPDRSRRGAAADEHPPADAAASPHGEPAPASPHGEPAPAAPQTVPFPEGLHPDVVEAVKRTGIPSLYPPQAEALAAVLDGRNVLVAIPTASGKSLIAHMAALQALRSRGGKALYVVPLRALASEKYEELRELATHLAAVDGEPKLRVAIATGDLDEADNRLGTYDIIVTTSEKADSLMRHKADWLRELGCVVADEIHLLGDSHRGPTLEVLLARMKALNPAAQIIGLSATVGNAPDIAAWLDARLVTATWRPVRLKEGILLGNAIFFADGTVRDVPEGRDDVVRLALQTLEEGGSALVFVNTRRSTEAVALRLAPKVKATLEERDLRVLKEEADRLRSEDGETSRLGTKLADAIERGSAFHNAGLSSSQRRTVETLYRAGHVKVIVATPTLAAGVNLPARRVILRDHTRYDARLGMNAPLPVMEVKQMTGRAGRPRYDPWGEAVLIAKDPDGRDALFETYLRGEPEAIRSHLGTPAALRIHLLSGIATGLTSTRDEILRFVESTFLARDPAYSSRWQLQDRVDDVLRFLIDNDFVEVIEEQGPKGATERLRATLFGKHTSDLYIDPESSLILRDGLRQAETRVRDDDELPSDMVAAKDSGRAPYTLPLLTLVASTPDVLPLWLRKQDEWVGSVADEHADDWLVPSVLRGRDDEVFLAELKTGLLLQDWIDETPLERIEDKYQLGPGDIHNRVQIAEWLLHAAEAFARMDRLAVAKPVNKTKRRVHHGCREDLLRIVALQGIGRYRARVLARAGFDSIGKLQEAPATKLLQLSGFGPRIVANLLKQLDREADLGALKRMERSGTDAAPSRAHGGDAPPRTDDGAGQDAAPDDKESSGRATEHVGRKAPAAEKDVASPHQSSLAAFGQARGKARTSHAEDDPGRTKDDIGERRHEDDGATAATPKRAKKRRGGKAGP